MDFKNIIDFLSKSDIKANDIYGLVSIAQQMDLTKEDNQRELIQKACSLTGKTLTKDKENEIIKTINEKGISSELLTIFYK